MVCFRVAIEWTRLVLLGPALEPSFPRVVLVPALAGLVVAAAVVLVFPMARGSGVQQTKAAVYISNGYIPFRTVIAKFITCALAIGGGHSLGPEDPSLQIGAGLASLFGRRLQLSRDKLRLIAPVGAAAGLAAAFNSPITAVLFVIEEVIGTWSAGALGAIVLSAVAAVVTQQWFLGGAPLFRVPAVRARAPAGARVVLGARHRGRLRGAGVRQARDEPAAAAPGAAAVDADAAADALPARSSASSASGTRR